MVQAMATNETSDEDLIDRTAAFWEGRLGRAVSQEDARQIAENMVGFFSVLAEWSRAETPRAANDNRPTAMMEHSGHEC